MRHARLDYDRIQDPALADGRLLGEGCTPIGEDEPVFLLRAKDMAAPLAVEFWAQTAENMNADPKMVEAARFQAREMRRWQQGHGAQVPDMPAA